MHLDAASLLSKFINFPYWAGVVTDTGSLPYTGISNIEPAAKAQIPSSPPPGKGNLGLSASSIENRDLHAIWRVDTMALSQEDISSLLIESSTNVTRAWNLSSPPTKTTSRAALDNYSPYLMTVSAEEIRDGFYKKLMGLQGQRETWDMGSAWESEDSSAIWDFTRYQDEFAEDFECACRLAIESA